MVVVCTVVAAITKFTDICTAAANPAIVTNNYRTALAASRAV